jgi:hypothetical protein
MRRALDERSRVLLRAFRALVGAGASRGRAMLRTPGAWPIEASEEIRDAFIELAVGRNCVTQDMLTQCISLLTGYPLLPESFDLPARMPPLKSLYNEACAQLYSGGVCAAPSLKLRDFETMLATIADRFLLRRENSALALGRPSTRVKCFRGQRIALRRDVFNLSARGARRSKVPQRRVEEALRDAGLEVDAGEVASLLAIFSGERPPPADGAEPRALYADVERLLLSLLPAEATAELLGFHRAEKEADVADAPATPPALLCGPPTLIDPD